MANELYADLAWLPPTPADFRAQCKALLTREEGHGAAIRWLATQARTESHLARLAAAIGELQARGTDLSPLSPFKLGLLGGGTLDMLVPALVGSAARHGVALEVVQAHYGQTIQEALQPDSKINRAKPDAVLFALDHRAVPQIGELGKDAESAAAGLNFINTLRQGFRGNCGAFSIVQTLAPPAETLFGGFDRAVSGTPRAIAESFNRELVASLEGTPDILFDVAALAETVGLAEWYSPEQWNLAKLPFSATYVPLYADHVGRLLGALRGKARRCLILDLDNTVWGGVIGDDGLDGIKIAQGDATGEAHLDVQRTALALRSRGVVLAVSSKNTDEVARAAFREHPEMLLRENHIAVFQANWNDKASNIRAISQELALGLESMVFLDDNPVERGLIRQLLPEVAVPEVPEDPALFARTLMAAGYFEAIAFSEEDRKRAGFYQDNAKRLALQSQVGGVEDYLASLQMEIGFAPFDATGRERITQLINKSNQFNLTTRRYTEAEVAAVEADPSAFALQVRLVDMFGDNGMISVLICRPRSGEHGPDWDIDTWLMSCRVLGRRVEHMVLREMLLTARARGINRLIGTYKPTARNDMVKDHYGKLGFTLVESKDDGETVWAMDTSLEIEAAPMTVRRAPGLEVQDTLAAADA